MPSDNTGAIIGAGGGIIGSAIDAISQIGQNKKAREHQEYMYDKQNAYNTPTMQMQRYKDAGLNPHLIYGQGNSGNAGSPPPLQTQDAPKSNFADITQNYIANRTQQAQVDNMRKALEVQEADKILKQAQTVNTLSQSSSTDQQREQSAELFETVQAQAHANLGVTEQQYQTGILQQSKIEKEIDQLTANTGLTNAQKSAVTQSILESKARVQNLRMDNNLKQADVELKQLELNLRRNGINPNDPAWMRILTQMFAPEIKKASPSGGDYWKLLKGGIKSLWQHQNK